mmetsp:Transcript_6837/g.12695  ORF Transcript_6837/g.12695 Transcript_6837/m.12695 type:complete len:346 (-) Transcript_6837:162-1199(-)
MAYSVRSIDRDLMKRDVDGDNDGCRSDDDSEWLDDPVAVGLQPLNDAARALPSSNRGGDLPNIERPDHISPETHDLVLKTMRGGDSWRDSKAKDEALVALRVKRMAELRTRAHGGGVDGRAAALVAAELEDLDGERLTRHLTTMNPNEALVVHVHTPAALGSAVLDAALATLAARHSELKRHRDPSRSTKNGDASGGGRGRCDVRALPGGAVLAFARLSAVDAGVTARLDMVDEAALPAILVYRNGKLEASRMSVVLANSSRGRIAEEDGSGGRRSGEDGGAGDDRKKGSSWNEEGLRLGTGAGRLGAAMAVGHQDGVDRVAATDDLEALADDVEDLLDDLGLYD